MPVETQFGVDARAALDLAALLEDTLDLANQSGLVRRARLVGPPSRSLRSQAQKHTRQDDEGILHVPISHAKSRRSLQNPALLLELTVLSTQADELCCLCLLLGQCYDRAGRQNLIAPTSELIGMHAKLFGNRLQRTAAFFVEFALLRLYSAVN